MAVRAGLSERDGEKRSTPEVARHLTSPAPRGKTPISRMIAGRTGLIHAGGAPGGPRTVGARWLRWRGAVGGFALAVLRRRSECHRQVDPEARVCIGSAPTKREQAPALQSVLPKIRAAVNAPIPDRTFRNLAIFGRLTASSASAPPPAAPPALDPALCSAPLRTRSSRRDRAAPARPPASSCRTWRRSADRWESGTSCCRG